MEILRLKNLLAEETNPKKEEELNISDRPHWDSRNGQNYLHQKLSHPSFKRVELPSDCDFK